MNDAKRTDETQSEQDLHDPLADSIDEPHEEPPPAESGLRSGFHRILEAVQQKPPAKAVLAKDRTRLLTLLIGGIVAAVLLFIGVISDPARSPLQKIATHRGPSLGTPNTGNQSAPAQGSVTPLLHADVRSNSGNSGELSPADIRGTSRTSSESDEISPPEPVDAHAGIIYLPQRPATHQEPVNIPPEDRNDPLASYRANSTGAPTYSYGGSSGVVNGVPPSRTNSYRGAGFAPSDARPDGSSSVKSSIVFVRASRSSDAVASSRTPATPVIETALLPPGTRLVARLEAAAMTAVKTPVVASIEYNYERDGIVIVPAGAKAIGEILHASTEGYLSVRFHTLQMPNGREEKIEGTGLALDHGPLKGEVSGKNTGRKILSRTLSGVGTIAAYVVGGGAGLSRSITGEALLRDRVAGNIALAGEQELMNAAYAENISVSVPANTRFYVVLQKAALNSSRPVASSDAVGGSAQASDILTARELRELMDLRREINRMDQESNSARQPGGTQ